MDLEHDPLAASRELERIEADPVAPRPGAVIEGDVLAARAGIFETEHRVLVEFQPGVAVVRTTQRFRNAARVHQALTYDTPLPQGAALISLEVCDGDQCRSEDESEPLEHDERPEHDLAQLEASIEILGAKARLVVNAMAPESRLTVRWRYAVLLDVVHGQARLVIPPRGQDERISAASIELLGSYGNLRSQVRSRGRVFETQGITVHAGASDEVTLLGRVVASRDIVGVTRSRNRARQIRIRERPAVVASGLPRLILADLSPSMRPFVGRLREDIQRIGQSLPTDTPVRLVFFSSQPDQRFEGSAGALVTAISSMSFEPIEAADESLARGGSDLARALEGAPVAANEHIILLTDGDFSQAELPQEQDDGLVFRGGTYREPSAAFTRWARGQSTHLFPDDPRHLLSLTITHQEASHSTQARLGRRVRTSIDTLGKAWAASQSGYEPEPLVLQRQQEPSATFYSSGEPAPDEQASTSRSSSLPRETVLGRLRTQARAPLRRCLRNDRRGRLAYAVRAEFRFEIHRGEVRGGVSARRVRDGQSEPIDESLQNCLNAVLSRVSFPYTERRLVVTYPIYTEPADEDDPEPLDPHLEATLREIFPGDGEFDEMLMN